MICPTQELACVILEWLPNCKPPVSVRNPRLTYQKKVRETYTSVDEKSFQLLRTTSLGGSMRQPESVIDILDILLENHDVWIDFYHTVYRLCRSV